MTNPDRHVIVLSAVTYNALCSLSKYRETMDDIVLKVIVGYAQSNHLNNDQITHLNIEFVKRFGEGEPK